MISMKLSGQGNERNAQLDQYSRGDPEFRSNELMIWTMRWVIVSVLVLVQGRERQLFIRICFIMQVVAHGSCGCSSVRSFLSFQLLINKWFEIPTPGSHKQTNQILSFELNAIGSTNTQFPFDDSTMAKIK
jgi:hypothetical protein